MAEAILTLEDQARLNLTHQVREDIITALTKGGLPNDNDDRKFLLAAMDGLDHSILTKARIKAQDKTNNNQAKATSMIAELLYRLNSNTQVIAVDRTIDLENDYRVDNLVPGETDQGVQHLTYDEFFKD
jgi:hypothetical protein